MSQGWIKLHRTLKDWEWYDDANCVLLLVHLLISVNYVEKKWRGKTVQPGSMILSWETLSKGAKLSVQQCRTAMKKLEDSGEVTRKVTGKYQVVSLLKWDKMQHLEFEDNSKHNSEVTDNQQLSNSEVTTTKESNNINNLKEIKNPLKKPTKKDFKNMLLDLGAQEQHIDDWFQVRDRKKAAYTKTVFKKFTNECANNNFSIAEAVKICAERGWQGFEYAWIKNINNNKQLVSTEDDNR